MKRHKKAPRKLKSTRTAEPHDVYQAASQAVDQDDDWPEYTERKINKRPLVIASLVILAVVIVAALGYGGYKLLKDHKSAKPATAASSKQTQPQPASTSNASSTQQYTANGSDLNLSFAYPAGWTVTPASGTDTDNQTITITSPSTTIESADNTSVTGKVVVTIRPASTQISELNSGNPTAAQSSAQFAYTAPTPDQHQYPYLTFIHFSSGSKAAGAFEEAMITGIISFTEGQPVTAGSLSDLDPVIAASFYRCNNTACSGQGAGSLSISGTTWQSASIFQQVQNLFTSLKLN